MDILKLELTDISEAQVMALAQFAKRLHWSDARSCAIDDTEAQLIIDSVVKLQKALDDAGYSPH